MEVNILITSISKKVWLIKAFQEALISEAVEGKVVVCDIDPLSAGRFCGDAFYVVPKSSENSFIDSVIDICKKESIKLIIPTRDEELLVFSENKARIEGNGLKVMVSPSDTIRICSDKYLFYQFLESHNFLSPQTWLPEQIGNGSMEYPLLVKSRNGSGSQDVFKANNKKELEFFVNYVENSIIQEYLKGMEYTVDLFADDNGKALSVVPRERIEVFGGESYKSRTINDAQIIDESKRLAEAINVVGHVTIQCKKQDDDIKFIEINPRFGGGAMLSIRSGGNTPRILVKMLKGIDVKGQVIPYQENLVMLRYTQDTYLLNEKVLDE